MYGIFISITGEEKDKLLSPGLNCRGCGQFQGVCHKCSDLICGDVLGILCACGLDVRVVRGRAERDSQAVAQLSGTNRRDAIKIDPVLVLIAFVFLFFGLCFPFVWIVGEILLLGFEGPR